MKYYVGGGGESQKNWRTILFIDKDNRVKKNGSATKAYPEFRERLESIADEQPTTAETKISDKISESSEAMVPSTSAEVSSIEDFEYNMSQKKKSS